MTTWKITLVSESEQLLGELSFMLDTEFFGQAVSVDVGDTSFPCLLLRFNQGSLMGKLYRVLRDLDGLQRTTLARAQMGGDRFHLIKVWM